MHTGLSGSTLVKSVHSTACGAAAMLLFAACSGGGGEHAVDSNEALRVIGGVHPPDGGIVIGTGGGPTLVDKPFYFRGLGNRCIDFGGQAYWKVGSPVTICT